MGNCGGTKKKKDSGRSETSPVEVVGRTSSTQRSLVRRRDKDKVVEIGHNEAGDSYASFPEGVLPSRPESPSPSEVVTISPDSSDEDLSSPVPTSASSSSPEVTKKSGNVDKTRKHNKKKYDPSVRWVSREYIESSGSLRRKDLMDGVQLGASLASSTILTEKEEKKRPRDLREG